MSDPILAWIFVADLVVLVAGVYLALVIYFWPEGKR